MSLLKHSKMFSHQVSQAQQGLLFMHLKKGGCKVHRGHLASLVHLHRWTLIEKILQLMCIVSCCEMLSHLYIA